MDRTERDLRLRVKRREHPDLGKLIDWVLSIADARHQAWQRGDPDPYGMPLPTELESTDEPARLELFVLSEVRERIEEKKRPRQGGPP